MQRGGGCRSTSIAIYANERRNFHFFFFVLQIQCCYRNNDSEHAVELWREAGGWAAGRAQRFGIIPFR